MTVWLKGLDRGYFYFLIFLQVGLLECYCAKIPAVIDLTRSRPVKDKEIFVSKVCRVFALQRRHTDYFKLPQIDLDFEVFLQLSRYPLFNRVTCFWFFLMSIVIGYVYLMNAVSLLPSPPFFLINQPTKA